jgi:NADH:ubiquinone oxidoreductase subunit 2 (subunit N)
MELLLLLAIAAFGATASGLGLSRGGRAGRTGAVLGALSLLGVVAVSFALTAPRVGTGEIPPGIGILDGRLIPNDYMRLVMALWALDGGLVVLVAWLAAGLAGLRGLMPAVLASIAGGAVALSATNLVLGTAAAGATGFVALLVLLAFRDPGGIPAAARELRVTMLATVLLMTAIVVAPLAAGIALLGSTGGSGIAAGGTGAESAAALVGILFLGVALAVGLRFGVLPFHLRVPQLTDVAPPIALPLLLAWVPLPLAVVGLAAVDLLIAPLVTPFALPLGGEQVIIIAVVIVTLGGASLAAFLQDDIRHMTGYIVIADGAIVLLGLAALTPDAWGPARIWLVALAATKTGLATWAAVMESRFGSRHLPDIRGWIRRSPLLGAALLVVAVASFGFPGWAAFEARITLAQLSGGTPLDTILIVLGFLTLPTYLRLLAVGTGRPTSRVDRAAPERIMRTRRVETLPVEAEGLAASEGPPAVVGRDAHANTARRAARRSRRMASRGATSTGRRLMRAVRRDATELTAACVLTIAILAALTAWGVLDISGASSEPAPITTNAASD